MNTRFIKVKQNTEDWDKLRLGKATASNFAKIMANEDKFGNPAKDYAFRIALEIVTGKYDDTNNFKNKYMERGTDLEYVARQRYEEETFLSVNNGCFYCSDKFGVSPDGNVNTPQLNGGIEIKVVIAKIQKERIKKGGFDSKYKWQIAGQFLLGNKDFVDYIQFCPEMPESKQIYIKRILRSDFKEEISKLKEKLERFWNELVLKDVEFLKNDCNCILINN